MAKRRCRLILDKPWAPVATFTIRYANESHFSVKIVTTANCDAYIYVYKIVATWYTNPLFDHWSASAWVNESNRDCNVSIPFTTRLHVYDVMKSGSQSWFTSIYRYSGVKIWSKNMSGRIEKESQMAWQTCNPTAETQIHAYIHKYIRHINRSNCSACRSTSTWENVIKIHSISFNIKYT